MIGFGWQKVCQVTQSSQKAGRNAHLRCFVFRLDFSKLKGGQVLSNRQQL
jgi:hypothetical protein